MRRRHSRLRRASVQLTYKPYTGISVPATEAEHAGRTVEILEASEREKVVSDAITRSIAEARGELDKVDDTSFSKEALATYEQAVEEYIRALALEASRCASRQRGDSISRADVEQAARYLFPGFGRSKSQHSGTFGGILLGAAVSNGLAIATTGDPKGLGLLGTVLLLVLGTALITYYIARD